MSNFVTALIKQRRDAKKSEPNTKGRLKEIIAVLRKYNYDNGITPEITVNILQDLGPTYVKIGQIASQQNDYLPIGTYLCRDWRRSYRKGPQMISISFLRNNLFHAENAERKNRSRLVAIFSFYLYRNPKFYIFAPNKTPYYVSKTTH